MSGLAYGDARDVNAWICLARIWDSGEPHALPKGVDATENRKSPAVQGFLHRVSASGRNAPLPAAFAGYAHRRTIKDINCPSMLSYFMRLNHAMGTKVRLNPAGSAARSKRAARMKRRPKAQLRRRSLPQRAVRLWPRALLRCPQGSHLRSAWRYRGGKR